MIHITQRTVYLGNTQLLLREPPSPRTVAETEESRKSSRVLQAEAQLLSTDKGGEVRVPSPFHPAGFEKADSTGHVVCTAGLTQWMHELKRTVCIWDSKSSHTPSGVGKMMNSSVRQPGSFLQRPFFTKVHASRKSLVCAALSSNGIS